MPVRHTSLPPSRHPVMSCFPSPLVFYPLSCSKYMYVLITRRPLLFSASASFLQRGSLTIRITLLVYPPPELHERHPNQREKASKNSKWCLSKQLIIRNAKWMRECEPTVATLIPPGALLPPRAPFFSSKIQRKERKEERRQTKKFLTKQALLH